MTEIAKKTFYQYLTAFQLVIAVFILIVNSYGMPETYEEMAVYVAVAAVAAIVYWKDKATAVDLKKIDLTPQQEYQIKSVVEWILGLLGYSATVEKPAAEVAPVPVPVPEPPPVPVTKEEFAQLQQAVLAMAELMKRDGTGNSG